MSDKVLDRVSDEELMEMFKELGTFYWLDPDAEEKDYRFLLNIHDMHTSYNGYNDFTVNDDGSVGVGVPYVTIDLQVINDEFYNYEVGLRQGFAVSELSEVQKVISIIYGSNFSIELKRSNIGWVRYEINIPMLKCNCEYDLEINIRALRHIIVQILNNVKLQSDYIK